jgi:transcriptional regulator with XRE-family HTH domain
MTLQGVNKWLKGESVPPYDKIIALAKWLNISAEELTFGLEFNSQLKEKNLRWKETIGYADREVFEAFLNLPAPPAQNSARSDFGVCEGGGVNLFDSLASKQLRWLYDSSLAGAIKLMFVWDGKTTFGWFFHI